MTNLSAYLAESASGYPDARAMVFDNTSKSYSALGDDVARFAEYLTDGGLQPGDQVGFMLPNGPEFAVVFYGVMHAGGVALPLNPQLHPRAVDFYLTITGARMLFVSRQHVIVNTVAAVTAGVQPVEIGSRGIAPMTAGFAGRADPVTRAAQDVAVVLPVAATAGAHTITLTHGDLDNHQALTRRRLALDRNDVVMGCQPFTERSGMTYGLLAAVSSASTLVVPSFDPAFDPASAMETIAAERITVFEGVPAMYVALLDAAQWSDEDFTSLRACVVTDGTLPVDVSRRIEDRFECVVVHTDGLLAVTVPRA